MTNTFDIEQEISLKRSVRSELLPSPNVLISRYPCPPNIEQFISQKREEIANIIHGIDDRLLVVIGPCSIHNIDEGIEYAKKLSAMAKVYNSTLLIVMRVYLEKPRTTVGWKGLIYDPHLDGTSDINHGLQVSRQLLININNLELPCACEFLQPMVVHYIADLVSWAAIGARTTESQIHRELVSGLNIPTGFKNGTTGFVKTAVDACVASQTSHTSFTINHSGNIVSSHTVGNKHVHVVLRGGSLTGPNYSAEHILHSQKLLDERNVRSKIMIDCSHGNCMQDGERQTDVISDVCQQVAQGDQSIIGVMIESNLIAGRQTFVEGNKHLLHYGKSITDSCLSWETSAIQLQLLSSAVIARRAHNADLNYD